MRIRKMVCGWKIKSKYGVGCNSSADCSSNYSGSINFGELDSMLDQVQELQQSNRRNCSLRYANQQEQCAALAVVKCLVADAGLDATEYNIVMGVLDDLIDDCLPLGTPPATKKRKL